MKESYVQKEELLGMLTEIYDQLEELEHTLGKNLSGLRENWLKEQKTELQKCENQIVQLEEDLDEMISNQKTRTFNRPQNMKLELGF